MNGRAMAPATIKMPSLKESPMSSRKSSVSGMSGVVTNGGSVAAPGSIRPIRRIAGTNSSTRRSSSRAFTAERSAAAACSAWGYDVIAQ
jgi:hypothetical protein